MNKIDKNYNKTFEDIKHIDENGIEFWYARELMHILQYAKWQNFKRIIDKAMIACENSEISIKDCFTDMTADGGLRQIHPAASLGKITAFHNGNEDFQLFQTDIHRYSPLSLLFS